MKSIEKILFPNHSLNDICEKIRDVQAYFIEKYHTLLSRSNEYFKEKMNKTRERGLCAAFSFAIEILAVGLPKMYRKEYGLDVKYEKIYLCGIFLLMGVSAALMVYFLLFENRFLSNLRKCEEDRIFSMMNTEMIHRGFRDLTKDEMEEFFFAGVKCIYGGGYGGSSKFELKTDYDIKELSKYFIDERFFNVIEDIKKYVAGKKDLVYEVSVRDDDLIVTIKKDKDFEISRSFILQTEDPAFIKNIRTDSINFCGNNDVNLLFADDFLSVRRLFGM